MSAERAAARRRRTASLVSLLAIGLVAGPLSFWLSVGAVETAAAAVLALGAVSLAEIAASWVLLDGRGG